MDDQEDGSDEILPQRAGHGARGPGGHFMGPCLCSPYGCGHTDEGGDETDVEIGA